MKTLTLIRHAKSSWNHPGLADFDRPLNSRGERDAPRMGIRLAEAGLTPDLIVTSPAARAQATCRCLADALGYAQEHTQLKREIYEAGLHDLVDVVRALDPEANTVCMVGHNPGFSEFAHYLSGEAIGSLPTCGVVHLRWKNGAWADLAQGSGELVFFDYPKNDGPVPHVTG